MQPTTRLYQLPPGVRDVLSRTTLRTCARPAFSTHQPLVTHMIARPWIQSRRVAGVQQKRRLTISQLNSKKDDRERVVILGSGWAGYTVARELDPKKYQPIIVSPRSYFAFTPLLASTAVGTLEFRTALEPIRTRRTNVNFFQGWADAVDFKNKKISIEEAVDDPTSSQALTENRHANESKQEREEDKKLEVAKGQLFDLTYDKLILAVGCYSQTFNTKGVKEHALFLKDVGDARKIRNRILACFEAAALPTTSDEHRRQLLNFAIVGGGPTGIEFAAELHDLISEDFAHAYPELIPFHKITVYDVATKVLPMFDEKLGKFALNKFKREGINIKTSHHVEELRPGAPGAKIDEKGGHNILTLKIKEEGELGVGMVVWSTGLMQNPFVADALNDVPEVPKTFELLESGPKQSNVDSLHWKVKKDERSGSVLTDSRLRLKLTTTEPDSDARDAILSDVYAIGDCAILEGTSYPATAQVASQKASWLAKRLNKGDMVSEFTFKNMGVMAYIGDWNALFQGGGGGSISGRLAWVVWRGAYLTKSVSVKNKILIPIYWLLNWMTGRHLTRF